MTTRVFWLAIAGTLLLVPGCGEDPAGAPDRGGFQRGPTRVAVAPVVTRLIRDEIEAIGTAHANESITVTAKVTDTVSKVRFEDGQIVSSGDVLVELTNEEQRALLDEAEANVDDARRQLKRLENLLERRSVPVSTVDEARSRFNADEARYQSVLARLDDRLIRAPFAGVLGFRTVSEGTLITPGTPITTLDDTSVIKLDFFIPEVYLGAVAPGLSLRAVSAAYPDRAFPARVETVASRVDPVTRAVTVRAHIDNADLVLRPGMLMVVQLQTNERSSLMVPEIALLQRADEAFVYVVDDEGRAQTQPIELGGRYDGWAEVLAGLEEGQPVITEGVIKVQPNTPVSYGEGAPRAGAAAGLGAR